MSTPTPDQYQRIYIMQINLTVDLLQALRNAIIAGEFEGWVGNLDIMSQRLTAAANAAHCANHYFLTTSGIPPECT